MANMSATRISGLILIIGALLMLVAALFRPGSYLIEANFASDVRLRDTIQTFVDYALVTHLTSLFGALGMLMMLFGFFSIRQVLSHRTASDVFIRFGVLLTTFGLTLYALNQGLNHMIVHYMTHGAERNISEAILLNHTIVIQAAKVGISIIAGYGYLLGFTFMSLGLYLRFASGVLKTIAGTVCVVSFLALIGLIIGDHFHDVDALYRVARIAVLPLNLWGVVLGVAMYREHSSLTPEQSE